MQQPNTKSKRYSIKNTNQKVIIIDSILSNIFRQLKSITTWIKCRWNKMKKYETILSIEITHLI